MGRRRGKDLDLPVRMLKRGNSYYHKNGPLWQNLGRDRKLAILRYCEIEDVALTPDNASETILDELRPRRWRIALFRQAMGNAKLRGMPFEITQADVDALAAEADGRCQITGIAFDYLPRDGKAKRPFAPSLDRIDPTVGYLPDNIRLVCVAVNLAMNEWGVEVLLEIGRALKKKRLI